MNNSVGYAPVDVMLEKGKVLLGTDGIGSDMFEEFRAAAFKASDAGKNISAERFNSFMRTNFEFAGEHLDVTLGRIKVGAAADLILMDRPPQFPLDGKASLYGSMLFAFSSRQVCDVFSQGEWRMRDRKLLGIDEHQMAEKISSELPALGSRLP